MKDKATRDGWHMISVITAYIKTWTYVTNAGLPLIYQQKSGTLGTSELVKRDLKVTKKGPKLRFIRNQMSRQTTLWSLLLLYMTILDIKNVNILIKRM